jgi:hypothetical protein
MQIKAAGANKHKVLQAEPQIRASARHAKVKNHQCLNHGKMKAHEIIQSCQTVSQIGVES